MTGNIFILLHQLCSWSASYIIIGNKSLDRKPLPTASKAISYKASMSKDEGKEVGYFSLHSHVWLCFLVF